MKKEGTVIEVVDDEVRIGCDKTACEGCKGSFFCTVKDSSFTAIANPGIELKKGDRVVVDMPAGKTIGSVFISLGLPMLMFLPGYFLGRYLFSSEIGAFFTSIAFVAAGFLIAYLYFRTRKRKYSPIVEEKKE